MRISDWSADVCSSDLVLDEHRHEVLAGRGHGRIDQGREQDVEIGPALLALPPDIRDRLRVALQYKGDDADAIAARLREAGIDAEVRPFFDDMGARLRAAHLVITRAGATTAADLLTVGRPPTFVPIPHGGPPEGQDRKSVAEGKRG